MQKTQYSLEDLETVAAQIRGSLVEMSHEARAAHLGSALSCVDILVVLYWNILNLNKTNLSESDRDRFILSKGHAASALYSTLAFKGIIEKDELKTYGKTGSDFEEHPPPNKIPGVEAATGSLGHGLPLGTGIALSGRILKTAFKTIVLVSDGECNEGSVWEAAMYASGQKLSNLAVIVDFNKWQATGRSCEVSGLEPLREKWESFGWESFEVDGHDIAALDEKMKLVGQCGDKPCAIIAHTVKGKGVSFMEDDNNWHYRIPTAEEVILAKKELGLI